MNPKIGVGAVIRNRQGDLLLIRRGHEPAQGRWAVPGGRVRAGERLEDAVVREVAEETGLKVQVAKLLHVAEIIGAGYHWVVLDFGAEWDSGFSPHAGSDAAAVKWVPFQQVMALELAQGMDALVANPRVQAFVVCS